MYERRGGSVFGAFLLGGLVGAVLGLLFAPRSGKETRDMLADRAEEYWGEGVDLYNTGKERAVDMYSTGRERVGEQGEALRAKIDEARGKLQEQVAKSAEGAREKIGEYVPAAKSAVDRAAEATKGGIETAGTKAQETLGFVSKQTGDQATAVEASEMEVEIIETPSAPEL